MKIIHISISDSSSGSSIAAERLHSKMLEDGHESKMLVLVKTRPSKDIKRVSLFNRYINARIGRTVDKLLSKGKCSKYGSFSYSYYGICLVNHSLVQEAEVIYLHWINGGYLSMKQIEELAKLRKPLFLYTHDMWYFTGGCHQSFGCTKYIETCSKCHFFPNEQIIDLVKFSHVRKKRIYAKYKNINLVCPSLKFYNMVLSSGIIEKQNLHYIPNLIDENLFKPINWQTAKNLFKLPKNKRVVLFGAMGGPTNLYKGWLDFIEAVSLISIENSKDYLIVIFGYNFKADELNSLGFDALSVGNINDKDKMVELYNSSDVYVFPSYYESFGQTMYEALSCGLPVVAYNVGAADDLIDHKSNGYIAKYRDVTDLAQGIEYVLENKSKLSAEARLKIVNEYSSKQILGAHYNMLNMINYKND